MSRFHFFAQTSIPEWDLVSFLDFVDHLDLRPREIEQSSLGNDPGPKAKVTHRSMVKTFVEKLKKNRCSHQRLKQDYQKLQEMNGILANKVNKLEQENAALQKCIICTKPYSGVGKTSCSKCGQIACRECAIRWASEATTVRAEEIVGSVVYSNDSEKKAAIVGAARALVMFSGITFRCPFCKGERLGSSL